MLTGRPGERLPDWLDAVRQDDLPSLHALIAGIGRDRAGVIAVLTLALRRAVAGPGVQIRVCCTVLKLPPWFRVTVGVGT
ncbi:hypothetical protein [Streptomyces sp. NPDC008240]|uniref:hypothetical protein n=1 Tax=Streptomyces sp. NPDC008240 TaxID=3364822 RepID=UPI0036E5BF9C